MDFTTALNELKSEAKSYAAHKDTYEKLKNAFLEDPESAKKRLAFEKYKKAMNTAEKAFLKALANFNQALVELVTR